MPYVVTQSCCADASCVVACPVNCIHPAPGEPGFATTEMLYVDPDACVGCGACATACPVDAVKPHTSLSEDEQAFVALNADYYATFPHADRAPVAVVTAQRRLRRPGPFRVAVVGAGPAGMYVADEVLKHPGCTVDVFDRLPTPYGLVRAGVAPDHPHTKQAERLFRAVEDQPGFGYLLGVEVGRDVSFAELGGLYDVVVVTVGAAADRRLGVPGEDLPGSLAATDLVGWYNGHPDQQHLSPDLSGERVVVVGNGNVALDVARVLTADPDDLAGTDIGDTALAALRESTVREVLLLGRRGPAQAAFTMPELVGLAALARAGRVNVVVESGGVPLDGTDPRSLLLADLARRRPLVGVRTLVLRFHAAPQEIVGDDRVVALDVVATRLEPDAGGVLRAVSTDRVDRVVTGLVLRSVGYHGVAVPGLPYDAVTGTVPHVGGRVRPGLYAAGWVKRGPNGFIGTNKSDAQETVSALLDDLDAGATPRPVGSPRQLPTLLAERGVQVVDLAGWRAIDAEERRLGALAGRPRRKLTGRAAMLAAARGYPSRRAGHQKRG